MSICVYIYQYMNIHIPVCIRVHVYRYNSKQFINTENSLEKEGLYAQTKHVLI